MVTSRVEASPGRYDFAKLGETIAASLVQAAQEHANHASVLLEQTKQFADDIRSQVAASSSEPAFNNYASGLVATRALRATLRLRRPLPAVEGIPTAVRLAVGPRNQARRLSADGASRLVAAGDGGRAMCSGVNLIPVATRQMRITVAGWFMRSRRVSVNVARQASIAGRIPISASSAERSDGLRLNRLSMSQLLKAGPYP